MVVFFLDFFFLFLKSWREKKRKKRTEQEKNSNTFTQQLTNQGRVLFSCFFSFFLDLAKNILCMLTNSFQNGFLKKWRKNEKQKPEQLRKEKKMYTTCKLLHKRKAPSFASMQEYCPNTDHAFDGRWRRGWRAQGWGGVLVQSTWS